MISWSRLRSYRDCRSQGAIQLGGARGNPFYEYIWIFLLLEANPGIAGSRIKKGQSKLCLLVLRIDPIWAPKKHPRSNRLIRVERLLSQDVEGCCRDVEVRRFRLRVVLYVPGLKGFNSR